MKFRAKAATLAKELSAVLPLAGKRTSIPILSCVLIRGDKTGLTLTTTDCDSVLLSVCDASVGEPGAICVDAKRLLGIISSFKGDSEVFFDVEKDSWINIQCGSAKLRIPGQDAQDFPVTTPPPNEIGAMIPAGVLAEALHRVTFAADDRGVKLTIGNGEMRVEATNGSSASVVARSVDTSGAVTIHADKEPFDLLAGILKDTQQPVNMAARDGRAWFWTNGRQLHMRLPIKDYPDIAGQMTKARAKVCAPIAVNRQELLASVRRAELSAPEQKTDKTDGATSIEFVAVEGSLSLKAEGDKGQSTEKLTVDYSGPEVDGTFASTFLRQALAISADSLKVQINKAVGCMFLSDDDGHEYILMGRR